MTEQDDALSSAMKAVDDAMAGEFTTQARQISNPLRDLLQARRKTHGSFTDHARITQSLKAVMHASPNWSRLTHEQRETLDMNAHKVGRILAGDPNHKDHWDDISGYATLVADML